MSPEASSLYSACNGSTLIHTQRAHVTILGESFGISYTSWVRQSCSKMFNSVTNPNVFSGRLQWFYNKSEQTEKKVHQMKKKFQNLEECILTNYTWKYAKENQIMNHKNFDLPPEINNTHREAINSSNLKPSTYQRDLWGWRFVHDVPQAKTRSRMVPVYQQFFVLMVGEIALKVGQRVLLRFQLNVVDPATLLDQFLRNAPVLEFPFQTWTAHVERNVEFTQTVVIEDRAKHFRIPIEKVLLFRFVVIQAGRTQTGQACSCRRRQFGKVLIHSQ